MSVLLLDKADSDKEWVQTAVDNMHAYVCLEHQFTRTFWPSMCDHTIVIMVINNRKALTQSRCVQVKCFSFIISVDWLMSVKTAYQ